MYAFTMRAALCDSMVRGDSKQLGPGPWRVIDVGGYAVVWRYASDAERGKGREGVGLRYVGRIVDWAVLHDLERYPEGYVADFVEQLRREAGL
jgi:hypothetical protein